MIRSTLAFLVLIQFSYVIPGQGLENSLLWKIEGKGIQPSYIFGTFHILPQSEFELSASVVQAFNSSEALVLELDTDDPGLQSQLFMNVTMKDGQRLDQLMKPDDLQKLDSMLRLGGGMGLEAFMHWKPMMLASLILTHYIEGKPASFEAAFTQMAAQNKKEVLGLELVSEQLALFDSIPYEEQVENLLDMINDERGSQELFDKMIRTYQTKDIDQMYRMISEYFQSDKQIRFLVTSRNQRWVPRITNLSAEQRVFYGVGAGHLGGEQGLINLLKEAGYQVTPVD